MTLFGHSVYDFFKDQGSIIAGATALVAALIAAGAAYFIGRKQIQVMQQQMRLERQINVEQKRLKVDAFLFAIQTETNLVQKTALRLRGQLENLRTPSAYQTTRREELMIRLPDVLRGGREEVSLLDPATQKMMLDLVVAVDFYNTLIQAPPDVSVVVSNQEAPKALIQIEREARHLRDRLELMRVVKPDVVP